MALSKEISQPAVVDMVIKECKIGFNHSQGYHYGYTKEELNHIVGEILFICGLDRSDHVEPPPPAPKGTEKITVNAEFLFELQSQEEWITKIPSILPRKIRVGESWIWVDANGNVFEKGLDFMEAEKNSSYPCKVYRLCSVSSQTQTDK